MESLYNYSVELNTGKTLPLSDLKGMKIIFVNVASECGFTPQYEALEELYDTFGETLVVIGFPCNDFGGQEPGDDAAIQDFCKVNYGVTFPMSKKIGIVTDTSDIYQWLSTKTKNGVLDAQVNWNFCKFLVGKDGSLEHFYTSDVHPMDERILDWVNS